MKKMVTYTLLTIFSTTLFVTLFKTPCLSDGKIILGAADPYPPFVDPSDKRDGLSLVIVRAAYRTQGYTVIMEYMPWARAEALTIKGRYDILPDVWMNAHNKKELLFSEPYAVNNVKFIKTAGNPFEYKGLESLKDKRIGTVRGYGYSDEFQASKDFIREDVADVITNIKKLVSKRIHLTLEDEIVAKYFIIKEDPTLLYKIRFTENSLVSKNLYVGSGVINPRSKELIEAFNKGLAEIKANGEFDKAFESYGIKPN